MATPIVMPKQGNTVEECLLSEWRVAEGDTVAEGDVIADIETDKATFEVEAGAGGTVLALFWEEGDLVPVLQNICVIGDEGEDPAPFRPESAESAETAESAASETAEEPDRTVGDKTAAAGDKEADREEVAEAEDAEPAPAESPMSPRARKFLREHPFELPAMSGSGPGGRILEQDVIEAYRKGPRFSPTAARMAEEGVSAPQEGTGVRGMVRAEDMGKPAPAAAPSGEPVAAAGAAPAMEDEVTEVKLSNIRKIIADRLHQSSTDLVQYTLNAEADVTDLLALRRDIKAKGEQLGLADVNLGDMILFATVKALLKHPEVNAEFTGDTLRQHSAVHLAFACDTPRGLMVPVIRNAHVMGMPQIHASVRTLARQANEGELNPDLLQGGTFTVSNLGALGVTTFTPVINAPQVGILGVGQTLLRPRRTETGVEHRDMLQLSVTLDHRVVDGAPGARFLKTLVSMLDNFQLVCAAI